MVMVWACGGTDEPTPDYDFDPPEEEDLYGVWDENVSDDDVAEIELARGGDGGLQAITNYDGTMIYFDGSEDYTYSRR